MFNFFTIRNAAIWTGVAIVLSLNLYVANNSIVDVPLVDGWAVWNRVMLLDFGEISIFDFIFTPHGAHPHSIVYLVSWFDFHWFDGNQTLMKFISFASICFFACFITLRSLNWKNKSDPDNTILAFFIACSTTAIILNLADVETLMQPFQVVMSFSRLIYFLLLWQLIIALIEEDSKKYWLVILLSCGAVTMHGAGYIFAAVIFLVQLLFLRRNLLMLGSILPFITIILMKLKFSVAGELNQLDSILVVENIPFFLKGVFAYLSTPLMFYKQIFGESILLFIGACAFTATISAVVVSLYVVMSHRHKIPKKTCSFKEKLEAEWGFVFASGSFVLLSAAAASAMWLVRTDISEDSYYPVMSTSRYGAYACIAYIILLYTTLQASRKLVWIKYGFSTCLCVMALYPTFNLNSYYEHDDKLNIASAGLAVGLSPVNEATEYVWPGAIEDWYWQNSLPKTVAYMKSERKGPWKVLPDLYSKGDLNARYLELHNITTSPVLSDNDNRRCHINANVLTNYWAETSTSILIPLTNIKRHVIGYGTLVKDKTNSITRPLIGFVLCSEVPVDNREVYAAERNNLWVKSNITEIAGSSPYNLSDHTWVKGIAKSWAGFFIEDTPINRAVYFPGRILRFSNKKLRSVIKQEFANGYLNVFLDGKPLDGNKVGYPNLIVPIN